MAKGPNQRLRFRTNMLLLIILGLGFGAAIFRIGFLQINMGEELQQRAVEQQLNDTVVNAKRGTIYDRNGEVVAKSASVWQVAIAPAYFKSDEERAIVSKGLAEILDLNQEELFKKTKKKTYYTVIKRKIDTKAREKVLKFVEKINDENDITNVINLLDDYKRYYPHDELASNLLGFTGSDDQGLSGLEFQYNDYLTGKSGRIVSAKNANGTNMPFEFKQNVEAEDGNSLKLTIDSTIQAICEKYMAQGIIDNDVKNKGVCIAMNPKTGEILAMVTANGYNLNDPFTLDTSTQSEIDALAEKDRDKAYQQALNAMWRNKAISDVYYPGSVFKMVTASMALEEGVVNDNTSFYCSGSVRTFGKPIRCHKTNGHGQQTFREAIWNSCNPAFIKLGELVGDKKFYEYYQGFGFSEKTGIDLPAEADDLFFNADGSMAPIDLAVASFGQNFGITPIQMCTAMSAVSNGGNVVEPYVVSQILDKDGNVVKNNETIVKRQVISKEVSAQMCDILEQNAVTGGAKNGYVAGYRIAGKTGTTEKIADKDGNYIASFGGFAPADNAEIAMLILFDTPKGNSYYGSQVAAPVFANIMSEVLPYLEVEKHYSDDELKNIDVVVDSYIGSDTSNAKSKARQAGLDVIVKGDGDKVIAQIPEVSSKMPNGGTIVLYTDTDSTKETVVVPDFIGLTPSEVNSRAAEYGLNISVTGAIGEGDSRSDNQSIEQGKEVRQGTVITVNFITSGTD